MFSSVFVFFIVGTVLGHDENQAKLRFYHDSMDNFTELFIDEAEKIFSTNWYNPKYETVVFCHGFTGYPKGPAITAVVSAYLSLGSYNVVLLNWEKLAAIALPSIIQSYIQWAVPNALQLGSDFSETLLRLSAAGLKLNKTHFVGHSLGAHIFGIAGNNLAGKGKQLPLLTKLLNRPTRGLLVSRYLAQRGNATSVLRMLPTGIDMDQLLIHINKIIGLDPAIGFEMKPAILRLNPTSAAFVAVMHSDPNKFGSKTACGVVDIWPNFRKFGPVLQPGCPKNAASLSDEDFCSHNRSWKLFVDAITHPGTVLASYAQNFRTWNRYTEKQRKANVLDLGAYSKNARPGNYYMTTAAEAPYGLGEKGL